MKKIIVHHFRLRGIKLWLLVFMCLFHISQSFAQIQFRFHKWNDEDGIMREQFFIKCDSVVIDGVTYRFHPGDPMQLHFINDDQGFATPDFILPGGYFTAEKYNDDLCSNVVLRGSLSGHYPESGGEKRPGDDFSISYKGVVGLNNPTQEQWEELDDDSFVELIYHFDNGLHAYAPWIDFTFPVKEIAPDLFTGKEKLESVSGKDNPHLTNMSGMFSGCTNLKSVDLSNFDTSEVTNMGGMFAHCSSLTTANLRGINTSNVTNMVSMFYECNSLTSLDLRSFDTSNVTDMSYMFCGCHSLSSLDISNFNTGKVKDMSLMFTGCGSLSSLDVSNFNTSNVTNMFQLFTECSTLTSLDVSNFNTSNVTNMEYMFSGCRSLTSLDVSNFNTNKVENMRGMFNSCEALTSLDVSNFNTSNVVDMMVMFSWCKALTNLNLSNFDTSNVTNMNGMFNKCEALTSLDLSNFNTSKVTDMTNMFYECSSLTSIDVSNFNTSRVTTMEGMFSWCTALKSLDVSKFNTARVINMGGMFCGCKSLLNLDVRNFNTSHVTGMGGLFRECSSLTSLDLSNFNTKNVIEMGCLFCECSSLTSLDLNNFATSNVTDMNSMFYGCSALTSLDISNFNTSKVEDMRCMFYGCSALPSLDLNNFETNNVTDMSYMFYRCSALTSLDLSSFNTSKVKEMDWMFWNCDLLTNLDLSNFNTSEVTNMMCMFLGCSSLTNLDVSGFNTCNVTSMEDMFSSCSSLTNLDVSKFNTARVINMGGMFSSCSSLTNLNLMNFDFDKVENIDYMFWGCNKLQSIYCKADLSGVEAGEDVFSDCYALIGGNGTYYNYSNSDKMYAHLDIDGKPGYFCMAYSGSDEIIAFAEDEVKRICVENWDTNGDGELSEAEASLVRIMGNVFENAKITTFNELEHFKGLVSMDGTFRGSTLETVKLPVNLKIIGGGTFSSSHLTSLDGGITINDIVIPDGITSIGGAFSYCYGITSIKIPASVESIGSFYYNSLVAFYVDENNPKYSAIDGVLFRDGTTLVAYPVNKPAAKYVIPEGITTIAGGAFMGVHDKLKDLTIPTTMTEIGWDPGFHRVAKVTSMATVPPSGSIFVDGASGTLFVPKGCKQAYAENYFWGGEWGYSSRIREFYEDDEVKYELDEVQKEVAVGGMAEGEKNLEIPESMTIDEEKYTVTAIAPHAFEGDTMLEQVTIPETIEVIGDGAFAGCTGLTTIYCYAKEPIPLGSDKATVRTRVGGDEITASTVFAQVNKQTCLLYVPAGSKKLYEVAEGWGEFQNIVEMVSEMPGDANNDGKVDADDIDAITRYIMEGDDEGVIFKNADVNGDEEINAADIVIIINKIK